LICCWQAGSTTTESKRAQKLKPSFRCKRFIPKSQPSVLS
jgi:hypothetical protein